MVPEADTGTSGPWIIGTDQSRLLSWSSGSGGLSVKVMSYEKLKIYPSLSLYFMIACYDVSNIFLNTKIHTKIQMNFVYNS